jgi:hypothetical protein
VHLVGAELDVIPAGGLGRSHSGVQFLIAPERRRGSIPEMMFRKKDVQALPGKQDNQKKHWKHPVKQL